MLGLIQVVLIVLGALVLIALLKLAAEGWAHVKHQPSEYPTKRSHRVLMWGMVACLAVTTFFMAIQVMGTLVHNGDIQAMVRGSVGRSLASLYLDGRIEDADALANQYCGSSNYQVFLDEKQDLAHVVIRMHPPGLFPDVTAYGRFRISDLKSVNH